MMDEQREPIIGANVPVLSMDIGSIWLIRNLERLLGF